MNMAPVMTCPLCGYFTWTRIRRWYMGRTTCWWCDYCLEIIPTLRVADRKEARATRRRGKP